MTFNDDTEISGVQCYKTWAARWMHYFYVVYGGRQFSFEKDNKNKLTGGTGIWTGFYEKDMNLVPAIMG
jgi:hypothetical protein